MNKKRPPKSVPQTAVWNSDDKVWELGAYQEIGVLKKRQLPIGEWSYWRADGTIKCIANFDSKGNQHGKIVTYHPDGTLASSGDWHQGNRQGKFVFVQTAGETDQSYPAPYATWRYEFVATSNWQATDETYYLKDGTQCTSTGRPLASAYDLDTVFAKTTPQDFLQKHAKKMHKAVLSEATESTPGSKFKYRNDPLDIEALWGCTIKAIDDIVNYSFEGSDYEPVNERRTFEGSIWRALIDYPWSNYHEELGAVFMGAVKIGQFGDSDNIFATLFLPQRNEPMPNAVYLWSHETDYIDDVLALSLDDFAYRTALASAYDQERLSPAAAQAGWRHLIGRTHADWGAAAGVELLPDEDFYLDLDPSHHIRNYFWRAQWILQLLRPDKERRLDDVVRCFRPNLNSLDDQRFVNRLSLGERVPQIAIYTIWRSYWFNQSERLEQCLFNYRNHRAAIVRDLVLLMDDIKAGKTAFKDIEDLDRVRQEFLKLDLLPERGEERTAEQEVDKDHKNEALASLSALAQARQNESTEAFIDLVWSHVNEPESIDLLETLARSIDGNSLHWKAFDFVKNRCETTDTKEILELINETGIWLGQTNSALLQPFIWAQQYKGDYATSGFLLKAIGESGAHLDNRLIALCYSTLDILEEYNLKRQIAVTLLGIMQPPGAVERLLQLIDQYIEAITGKPEFEASLETIGWTELLSSIALALQNMATPGDQLASVVADKLKQLLVVLRQIHDITISITVLDALIAWGETNVISTIARLLKGGDTRGEIAALRAVEKLACSWQVEERRSFVALDFCNPSDYQRSVTLMFYRALNALANADPDLGGPVSIKDAVAEAMQLDCYSEEDIAEWQTIECETVAIEPTLDISNIESYLRSKDCAVRKAARAAYIARGRTIEKAEPKLPWLHQTQSK